MTNLLRIRDAGDVSQIVTRLHDRWFDLDRVTFDDNTHRVTIPFARDHIRLVIDRASALRIDDPSKVGLYDFNTLDFDRSKGSLTVLAGVPVTLEIRVDSFEVSLEVDE